MLATLSRWRSGVQIPSGTLFTRPNKDSIALAEHWRAQVAVTHPPSGFGGSTPSRRIRSHMAKWWNLADTRHSKCRAARRGSSNLPVATAGRPRGCPGAQQAFIRPVRQVRYRDLQISCQSSVVSHQLSVISCQSSVISWQLSVPKKTEN